VNEKLLKRNKQNLLYLKLSKRATRPTISLPLTEPTESTSLISKSKNFEPGSAHYRLVG